MNIHDIVAAIHCQIRDYIEAQFSGYKVTDIEAKSKTCYAPTLASKDVYIMERALITFDVTAVCGASEIACEVSGMHDGSLGIHSVRQTVRR